MEKRGAGHVEAILAFVIFIGFVGFALYFFSPTNTSRLVDSSLTYAFSEVKSNASVELEIISVGLQNVDPDVGRVGRVGIDVGEIGNKNPIAEDEDGNDLRASKSGNVIYIDRADSAIIKLSEDFDNVDGGTGVIGDYGSTTETREIISEKRLDALKTNYDEDYRSVKKEFNLPDRVNFGIKIVLPDEEIVMGQEIPEGLEVFSDSERVEILKTSGAQAGQTVFGELQITIW